DLRQSAYDETRGFQVPRISEARPSGGTNNQPKERILIHITADPSTAMLIRRGRRVADYLHADCTALFVHQTPELSQLPAEERQGSGEAPSLRTEPADRNADTRRQRHCEASGGL